MATRNAARAIGLKMKGQLAIGTHADLVVLSPDLEVQRTFATGEEIFSLDRQ
jgi:N-acetylglucosamine-6-phosphate deacetylase